MKIKDLEFEKLIEQDILEKRISTLAAEINQDYLGKQPLFLAILNGSFMFAAELMKSISVSCEITFLRVSSYQATTSTGKIHQILGLSESIENRDIIIIEDIIDTGLTLQKIIEELRGRGAKSVEVVALLRKSPAREKNISAKYIGFELEEEFVLGYGLDYDGLGRNCKDIYKQIVS